MASLCIARTDSAPRSRPVLAKRSGEINPPQTRMAAGSRNASRHAPNIVSPAEQRACPSYGIVSSSRARKAHAPHGLSSQRPPDLALPPLVRRSRPSVSPPDRGVLFFGQGCSSWKSFCSPMSHNGTDGTLVALSSYQGGVLFTGSYRPAGHSDNSLKCPPV